MKWVLSLPALILLLIQAAPAPGQQWARDMFAARDHQFGTVARGATAEVTFDFQNVYEEEVRIAGIRTSCGCVSARLESGDSGQTFASWEKGQVVAKLNTVNFLGPRSAILTVVIDRPYPAEVQLTVAGYIRQDVVLTPGVIRFDNVPAGEDSQTVLDIAYRGQRNWRIRDVRSTNEHLRVQLAETRRELDRVNYRMTVHLAATAPAGYLHDEIHLVTTDSGNEIIRVSLEANVVAPLTVSPTLLTYGAVKVGEPVTRTVVVRGSTPFTVTDVRCDDTRFQATADSEAKNLQLVPITFTADGIIETIDVPIELQTTLGMMTVRATVNASPAD